MVDPKEVELHSTSSSSDEVSTTSNTSLPPLPLPQTDVEEKLEG
jgi:hypothetical protein